MFNFLLCEFLRIFLKFQGGCFLSTHKYDTKKNNQEKSYKRTMAEHQEGFFNAEYQTMFSSHL